MKMDLFVRINYRRMGNATYVLRICGVCVCVLVVCSQCAGCAERVPAPANISVKTAEVSATRVS